MHQNSTLGSRLNRVWIVISLALLLVWFNFTINDLIVKYTSMSFSSGSTTAQAFVVSRTTVLSSSEALFANPVASAFVNVVPGADGAEVFVTVSRVGQVKSDIYFNIDPTDGPASHQCVHAMTISGTNYLVTAGGFAPGRDIGADGDNTLSITTTVSGQIVSTGNINFQRAFVETTQAETISVDNGDFILEFLNIDSFQADTYVLVMATNAPPGPFSLGYQPVGQSYSLRPSGALTESEKLMTLNLKYPAQLPNDSNPHTLTLLRWQAANETWAEVGGRRLIESRLVTLATNVFGIYALATAPTWRDSFPELSLSGVSALSNTQRGPGETIILSNASSGSVTSIPIIPNPGTQWGALTFSTTIPVSTTLTVDVLDLSDSVVLTDVSSGTNLNEAGVDLATYPGLKLRANLSAITPPQTPYLHEWRLSWLVEVRKVYLPLVIR